MNKDIIQGNWKEVKGKLKQHWGKFTDNDITELKGSVEEISGLLQKRYGYQKDQAKKEIDNFINHNHLE